MNGTRRGSLGTPSPSSSRTTPKRPSRTSSSSLILTPSAVSSRHGTPASVERTRTRLHSEMEQLRRANEDLRKEAGQLRLNVDSEKQRVREAQRERNLATKNARENLEKEKQHIIETASRRAASDRESEMKSHYESLVRQKENEIRQLVKFREDEVKRVRTEMARERDELVRITREETERRTSTRCQEEAANDRSKLVSEMWSLRDAKMKQDEVVESLKAADQEKAQLIKRMKVEHGDERAELLRRTKQEGQKDAQRVRLAERILYQKETELAQQVYSANQLEADKDSLQEAVQRYKQGESLDRRSASAAMSRSMSASLLHPDMLDSKSQVHSPDPSAEQKLSARITRLQSTVRSLEERLAASRIENTSMQQKLEKLKALQGSDQGSEEKMKKLKRRNLELNTLAKQLQEKLRTVQTELAASQAVRESSHSEAHHHKQRQRSKDAAEHRQQLADKEQETIKLKHDLGVATKEIQTLKASLQEARNKQASMAAHQPDVDVRVQVECLTKDKLSLERRNDILLKQSAEMHLVDTLKAQTASLESEIKSLMLQNEEAEGKVERMRLLEVELEGQTARSTSLVQCIEQLESEKKKLESSCKAADGMAKELQQKMASMQQTLQEQDDVFKENSLLRNELRQTQKEVDDIQIECTSLKGQVSSLQQELEEASGYQERAAQLQTDLKSAEATIGSLQTQLFRQLSSPTQSNADVTDGRLSSSLRSFGGISVPDVSMDEVSDLREQVQSLQEECAEKELQCMALREQVDKLKIVVSHFQGKLDRADKADSDTDNEERKQTKRANKPSPLVQRDSSSSVTSPKHHVDALCGKAGQKPRPMIRVIHPSTSDMHDNLPPELRRRIMADDRTGDSSEDDINHNYSLEEEMNAAHAKEDEDNDGDDDTASASQTDSGGSGDDYMEDDDDDDDDDDDKTGSGEDAVSSGEEFSDGEEDEEASGSDVSLSQVFAAGRRHDSAEEDFDEEEDDEEAEKLLGLKPLHAFITPRNSASPTLDGRGDTAIHDTADTASHQDETTGEEDEDAGGDDDDEKSVIAESTEPENRVPTVPVIEVADADPSDGFVSHDAEPESEDDESSVNFDDDDDDDDDTETDDEDDDDSSSGDSDDQSEHSTNDESVSVEDRQKRMSNISTQSVLRDLSLVTSDLGDKAMNMDGTEVKKTSSKTLGNTPDTLAVVIAKYDYDSHVFSPNDPDEELSFKKGDYIYVHGQPDADGFYSGELMDGSHGLVPSNFVEPVVTEDQLPNDQEKQDAEYSDDEDNEYGRADEDIDPLIPAPTRLTVQRQHENSAVVVQWTPPSIDEFSEPILGYRIFVNKSVTEEVSGSQTSTTVSGLTLDKEKYVISVRTMTSTGTSCDPFKLLTVGRNNAGIHVESVKDLRIESDASRRVVLSWTLPVHTEHCNWHQVYVDDSAVTSTLPVDCCRVEIASHHFNSQPASSQHVYTVKVLTFCEALQQRLHSPEVRIDAATLTVVHHIPRPTTMTDEAVNGPGSIVQSADDSMFAVSEMISPSSQHGRRWSSRASSQEAVDSEVLELLDATGSHDNIDHIYATVSKRPALKEPHPFEGRIIADPLLASQDKPDTYGDGHSSGTDGADASISISSGSGFGDVDTLSASGMSTGVLLPKPVVYAALYDYDPMLQSPNPAGPDEELEFKEGDLIKVLRDIDASGFYFGELRGKQGLIPSNLVKRVAFESEDRREEAVVIIDTHGRHTVPQREVTASTSLTRIGSLTPISEQDMLSPSHNAMVGLSGRSADRHQRDGVVEEVQPEAISRHPEEQFARALYAYDPHCASPNPDTEIELSFEAGDILRVFGEIDEDGFYQGELQGKTGLVPSNFIEILPDEIIVEGDDGMLYVINEGMTGERGIDCDFQAPEEESAGDHTASAALSHGGGRAMKRTSSSTAAVGGAVTDGGKKKKKGIMGRSRNYVKKKLLPKKKSG